MKTRAELAAESGIDCAGGRWIASPEALERFAAAVAAKEIAERDQFVMQWQHALRVNDEQAATIARLRGANIMPRPTDEQGGRIWDLQIEVERLHQSLHDSYVVAALPSVVSFVIARGMQFGGREGWQRVAINIAREIADKAIAARK